MELNKKLLEEFRGTKSKLLGVTKYFDKDATLEIINKLETDYMDIFEGIGENRIEALIEKNIDRNKVHFIGNIQSKQIKDIIKFSSFIHSIDDIKHIKKIEDICNKSGNWIQIFLQINIDNTKKAGISIEKIPEYLEIIGDMESVSLIGFSAIGKSEFTRKEKEAEFDLLIKLRNKYLPNGFISAGTSIDYEIALEKGIDIVRVGSKLYN